MTEFFIQIWRLYQVPINFLGAFTLTAGQILIGSIVVIFSIYVLKHLLWR